MTVTGLDDGVTYTCKLRGGNGAGLGRSASTAGIPRTTPDPPSIAWTPGAASVDATWTPPADNGGSAVTGYRLRCVGTRAGLPLTVTVDRGPSLRSVTMSGLRNDVTYACSAASKNAAGFGAFSTAVPVTPTLALHPPAVAAHRAARLLRTPRAPGASRT